MTNDDWVACLDKAWNAEDNAAHRVWLRNHNFNLYAAITNVLYNYKFEENQ